ncbi:MAG: hypothetical protein GX022_08815 [Clostridiaceae bacterium]|nr:hypothetical protein [Clostridiaceae bacterium]
MKRRYLAFLQIIVLILVSIISGCGKKNNIKPGSIETSPGNELPECNWVMKVDQTIPKKYDDGTTVEHTLVFIAEKEGGTDVTGTYHGAFCLRSKLDISEFSNEGVEYTGGFDAYGFGNDVTFDIVAYDAQKFAKFGRIGDTGNPNLIDYETMAAFAHEITGSALLNPYVGGRYAGMGSGGINATGSGSAIIPVKIAIKSGKVHVDFPTLDIGSMFEGQLIEVPLGDNSQYKETMDIIEAMKEASKNSDSAGKDTGSAGISIPGGNGETKGQTGTNLEIPDSFPTDDVPVIPDAKIFNFYENGRKTNVAIMFGTDKSFDEVLEFYQENFISKLEKEPEKKESEGTIMFICEMEGYRNVSIVIMEDKSKTYNSIVALEVLK